MGWLGQIADEAEIGRDQIVEAVFVANPVMHHLLLGIDPTELGASAFCSGGARGDDWLPVKCSGCGTAPGGLGLHCCLVLPAMSAQIAAAVALVGGPTGGG